MAESLDDLSTLVKQRCVRFIPESVIDDACVAAGHRWRERKFTPVVTVYLFIFQILHQNTAILHLRHLIGAAVAASSYCSARMRLPLAVFETLLDHTARAAAQGCQSILPGTRVFLADCTSTLAPDTKALRKVFKQPANVRAGCGYPMPKILALLDAASGAILRPFFCSLYDHEAKSVIKVHPLLMDGDLLVADRAFCSYAHLALLAAGNLLFCFRVQQRQKVNFRCGRKHGGKGQPRSRWIRKLGKCDQLVEWFKPRNRPKWMMKKQYVALAAGLTVRELRYRIEAKGQRTREVTIVTSLLDPARYPAGKIADLYNLRWQVETHFAQMKTTMKMARLKCTAVEGVKKELLCCFIAYNLIRTAMREAAQQREVAINRISFIDVMRQLANARVGAEPLILMLIPHRPDRHEPRVIKYLGYRHRLMPKPRHKLKSDPHLYGGKIK